LGYKVSNNVNSILHSIPQKQNIKFLIKNVCNNIEFDNYSQGSIKASILGLLTEKIEKIPKIKYFEEKEEYINSGLEHLSINERNLFKFLFQDNQILEYQSLIDVAGFILDTNVFKFVEGISRYFTSKGIFKIILFVNDEGERLIYEPNTRDLSNLPLDHNYSKFIKISKYQEEVFLTNELFIYYDNKHTVGIDFKQPLILHGLILINKKNTLTQVAQGIFRLRKINMTHTVDFYVEPIVLEKIELPNNEPNLTRYEDNQLKLEKLYKFLVKNGKKYKESTTYYMEIQCLKYLIRRIDLLKNYYHEIKTFRKY
jgi:hypothetical protein